MIKNPVKSRVYFLRIKFIHFQPIFHIQRFVCLLTSLLDVQLRWHADLPLRERRLAWLVDETVIFTNIISGHFREVQSSVIRNHYIRLDIRPDKVINVIFVPCVEDS